MGIFFHLVTKVTKHSVAVASICAVVAFDLFINKQSFQFLEILRLSSRVFILFAKNFSSK